MEFDLENPMTCSDDDEQKPQHWDPMEALFATESDHMASPAGTFDVSVCREVVCFLLQAQLDYNLDPFVVYLAINYIHRFLSKRAPPMEKPWVLRLLAVSCMSLAFKMKSTDFSIADIQHHAEGIVFDARTIERMELLVLGALDWRMRSITPFSFLRHFISFFSLAQHHLLCDLKSNASQTIIKTQNNIKILEFKPSVVAAAALLFSAYELLPVQFPAFRSSVASSKYIDEEKLWECYHLMDSCNPSPEKASSCDTPVTVLTTHHMHCLISESERTSVGLKSDNPDLKKRRSFTFHISDSDA